MYDLHPRLDAEVEPGTNILFTGPPLTGKRSLCLDLLADGVENGEGGIAVTTKDSADRVLKDFAARTPYDGKPFAVVDCVTKQQGVSDVREDGRIKYASSPVDMTGIGIQLSEFLQAFYKQRNIKKNRVMLHSLSTLLMYAEEGKLYRLLSQLVNRARNRRLRHVTGVAPAVLADGTLARFRDLHDRSFDFE